MPKRLTILCCLALVGAMALPPAAGADPDADTVVARVNGEDITLGHMIVARASLPQQYQQLPDQVLYDAILEQLIQQNLLKQLQTGAPPKHVVLALDNERRSLLAAETLEEVMGEALTDTAMQSAYDAKYSDGLGEEEFNASHILVETEDEAATIKQALDNGADFAATAREQSTGPSGPNGGELGWFGLGAMVPEFEAAVVALEKGEVSDPVQTQFGWHIVTLNDRRKSKAPDIETVRDELSQQIRKEAVDSKVAELTASGEIERPQVEGLTPDLIREVDLIRE